MTNHLFELAGNRKTETVIPKSKKKWYQGKPVVSAAILILIVLGCLCAELIMTKAINASPVYIYCKWGFSKRTKCAILYLSNLRVMKFFHHIFHFCFNQIDCRAVIRS